MSGKKRNARSSQKVGIEERTDAKGREQYRGTVYDRRVKRMIRGPWTYSFTEARGWRVNAMAKLEAGLLSADRGLTVREAADEFVTGMHAGRVRNRSGRPYKPSAIRGYERDLNNHIGPTFGTRHLADLALPDVQRWADGLDGAPSTIRNAVNGLRALYGWALPRGMARINPTKGLRLPSGGEARDRIASPDEADRLLAVLSEPERAIYATALYAGLRRGELMALRVADVDLDADVIHIDRDRGSYDPQAKTFGPPKSDAAARPVPIVARLRPLLVAAVEGKPALALVFGRDANTPFSLELTTKRGRPARAWETAGLRRIGLHEARHTFASYLIAAQVAVGRFNPKAIQKAMGHSSIQVTYDRYGKLFPGSDDRHATCSMPTWASRYPTGSPMRMRMWQIAACFLTSYWPSKPVRRGSPTLGRFDSFATPYAG
jgi:integrase